MNFRKRKKSNESGGKDRVEKKIMRALVIDGGRVGMKMLHKNKIEQICLKLRDAEREREREKGDEDQVNIISVRESE